MSSSTADPNPRPVQKVAYWAWWTWVGLLAAAAGLEVWGIASPTSGDTLSEVTRDLWQTDTAVGAWLFRAAWAAFAAWFGPHIVRLVRQGTPEPGDGA